MHRYDQFLWEQLRARDEGQDRVEDPADITFLQIDPSGSIRLCSPDKIRLSRVQWLRPDGELVPRPFSTMSDRADSAEAQQLLDRLRTLGEPSVPFIMDLQQAGSLLDQVCSLIRIDEGWEWDFDALKDSMTLLTNTHPDETQRNRVACIYTLNNNIRKWVIENVDPQRAPYSEPTEDAVRREADRSPALALYHNVGNADRGWRGSPFVWPVLFVPRGVQPTVFANNRRIRS
jgi:hypothetical protein